MSRVALRALALSICLVGISRPARADCIVAAPEDHGEIDNSVAVLQALTHVTAEHTKRTSFPQGNDPAIGALKTALTECAGKAYFVGHAGELSKTIVQGAVSTLDAITDAYVYVCKCPGGVGGKVRLCTDEVIWPIDISGVKGFLIKRTPWEGMNYPQGGTDLASAGAALLEKLKLIKGCPAAEHRATTANEEHRKVEELYKREGKPSSGPMKEALDKAIVEKTNAKESHDKCKSLKAPATLGILTGFGQPGPTTITRVNADGVVH